MTFEIEINGQTRTVSIDAVDGTGPQGGRFRVLIDGTSSEVDCRPAGSGLSLIFTDGRSLDALVIERPGGEWLVQLPHVNVTALVDGRRYRRGRAAEASGGGQERVTAPMPGRVIRILVQLGDEVATRQGLVVVEAMKMENELGSPKAGRIREIAVSEGMSIEAGRLLVVVE